MGLNKVTSRPGFTPAEAEALARDRYGIHARATELPSERDRNFLLRATGDGRGAGRALGDGAGDTGAEPVDDALVLKIGNPAESRASLEMQAAILARLAERWSRGDGSRDGVDDANSLAASTDPAGRASRYRRHGAALRSPFPAVVPDLSGATLTTVEKEGVRYPLRAVTWLPGVPVAGVRPQSPELLRSWGGALAQLDAALADFEHPAADTGFHWDLRAAPAIFGERVGSVRGKDRRALLRRRMADCEQRLAPLIPRLRTQVAHGDANDYNVLANRVDDTPRGGRHGDRRVTGIIDFGDAMRTWLASEPAVAGAYAMLSKRDPAGALARLVSGFHEQYPLREEEIAAIFPLTGMRLCLSATMAAHQRAREPGNEYLGISEPHVWELLERLGRGAEFHPRFVHYRLREACGLEACPRAVRLRAWLARERDAGRFAPVLPPEQAASSHIVFDLSVGSRWLGTTDNLDARGWTDLLFGHMRAKGAAVGVGRYDEARRWYDSDAFAVRGEDGLERRTVHVGVDLFAAPGTPVHAPCDAIVHSFRDNDAPLDYGPTIVLRHEGEGGEAEGGAGADGAHEAANEVGARETEGHAGTGTHPWYTLYGHLSRDSLEGLRPGRKIVAGEEIGRIGPHPENGDWAPHLHFQLMTDLLGREGDFPGVAPPGQRDVWLSLSPDPNLVLGIPDLTPAGGNSASKLLGARRRLLGPSLSISYRRPLEMVRGKGAYLYDAAGQPYLDCVNNVAHVGHAHPRVVRAGLEQMSVLNTNTRYLHDSLTEYARRLAATLPDPLGVCFFVCTGSEANELALRMARTHTGRDGMVVLEGGYHGNTSSLVRLSSYKFDGPGGEGAPPGVACVPMPDGYRGRHRSSDPDCGARYAEEAGRAIVALGGRPAGFLFESILSCGGQIPLPHGFLRDAFARVRSAGGVCIADEVQVGFGRAGSSFWAFEAHGVVPDIVTMGKPIGNGHPLAAVVTTPEIADSFNNGMEYFNTFGGNPVSCRIGLAVLDVIEQEGLRDHARRVGERLLAGLKGLVERHHIVGDARGTGLFQGIELVTDRDSLDPAPRHASYLVERMRDRGILLSTDGPLHNVVKIKPPLVFDEDDADRLVGTLDEVLREDALRLRPARTASASPTPSIPTHRSPGGSGSTSRPASRA